MTLEEAFEKTGGFGRFQLKSSINIIFTMVSTTFFLNSFASLEIMPKFECKNKFTTGPWYSCTNEEFCENENIEFKVDSGQMFGCKVLGTSQHTVVKETFGQLRAKEVKEFKL